MDHSSIVMYNATNGDTLASYSIADAEARARFIHSQNRIECSSSVLSSLPFDRCFICGLVPRERPPRVDALGSATATRVAIRARSHPTSRRRIVTAPRPSRRPRDAPPSTRRDRRPPRPRVCRPAAAGHQPRPAARGRHGRHYLGPRHERHHQARRRDEPGVCYGCAAVGVACAFGERASERVSGVRRRGGGVDVTPRGLARRHASSDIITRSVSRNAVDTGGGGGGGAR